MEVLEWFKRNAPTYTVHIDPVNVTAALVPSHLAHPPFSGTELAQYRVLVADRRRVVVDSFLNGRRLTLSKEMYREVDSLNNRALEELKAARKAVRNISIEEAPAVMQPVTPTTGPVTWESLALSRYGTLELTRGQKSAVTREYNRKLGLEPARAINHRDPAWIARAAMLYPGVPPQSLWGWQKSNVTKDLRRNP